MQLVHTFVTNDGGVFEKLSDLHVWAPAFKEQRLARQGRSITAMLLRTWRLKQQIDLPQDAAYWGCFSWGAEHLHPRLDLPACIQLERMRSDMPWVQNPMGTGTTLVAMCG
jgi:hypothetical protein